MLAKAADSSPHVPLDGFPQALVSSSDLALIGAGMSVAIGRIE